MTEKKKQEGAFWNNWKGTAIPATGSTISRPGMSGAYSGFKGGQTTSVAVDPFVADLMRMNPDEVLQVSTLLKNANYLRNTTRKYNKNLGDAYSRASMDWSNESARTGRPALTFREFLIENITPETGAKGPSLPTRQVYEVRKGDIEADVNKIALPILQREIVESDKQQDWYKNLVKAIQDTYAKGTVTTTKQVVNPKTGKKENVVTQSPKFSKEEVEQKITTTLLKADPESAARANRLDFARRYFGGGR